MDPARAKAKQAAAMAATAASVAAINGRLDAIEANQEKILACLEAEPATDPRRPKGPVNRG